MRHRLKRWRPRKQFWGRSSSVEHTPFKRVDRVQLPAAPYGTLAKLARHQVLTLGIPSSTLGRPILTPRSSAGQSAWLRTMRPKVRILPRRLWVISSVGQSMGFLPPVSRVRVLDGPLKASGRLAQLG